jgi:hypothetical protein
MIVYISHANKPLILLTLKVLYSLTNSNVFIEYIVNIESQFTKQQSPFMNIKRTMPPAH